MQSRISDPNVFEIIKTLSKLKLNLETDIEQKLKNLVNLVEHELPNPDNLKF